MTQSKTTQSSRKVIGVASLVIGPLLMSVGDLFHPIESMDVTAQVNIIIEQASRWYAAHLLLLIGMLIFIPGLLALVELTAKRKPMAGFACRILLLIGVGALCAVFTCEMLIGSYVADGADAAAATKLLAAFQSAAVLGSLIPGIAAFFGGVATLAIPLVLLGGRFRWPAVVLALGALFILAEIITSEVLLSQIGNIAVLIASIAFAWGIAQLRQPDAS